MHLTRLRGEMSRLGLDAVWIASPENHLYLSGFDNPDGSILVTQAKTYVFADFRYIEAARREAFPECTVIMPEGGLKTYLPPLIEENGVHSVGYEDIALSCRALQNLKEALPACEFVPFGMMMEELRCIKTEDEIEKIERAQRIAEEALEELLTVLTPEMTEIEAAAELEYRMKKKGSLKPSFDTIAVSGTNSSSPHGVPRNVKLERGFMTFDFGAMYQGYHSDMTRTIVIGHADAEMKRLYDTVLRAQLAALDAVRAGAENTEIDKIARDIIDGAGYAGRFGHGLGHGVGLKIHESPTVSRGAGNRVLHPMEVITVEPGIYLEGRYGCRIEDMAVVTPDGCRNLTRTPKELIEL
ncbi:MAG: M24 family metallopeptidase [Eubacteriales bacterium]